MPPRQAMAQRHWLDPLARRLLIATGQIPPPPPPEEARQEAVDRDLLALRLRQQPSAPLRDAREVARAAALGWRLDVNRATRADWLRLPGCLPQQADLLQRLRDGGVQLSGPDDLQRLLELDADTVAAWLPLLEFRWYGEPPASVTPGPLPLNRADARQLEQQLGLSSERLGRLLRERRRAPFRDLADLQQRLQLPPQVVEQWIGRVQFDADRAGESGPRLPPGGSAATR
ncbi:MAG: hypothetical protein VKO00_10505 [Cyanobacteriota bacterium]|nr:hypothetical protein [Cyanobacteriota bacterium]